MSWPTKCANLVLLGERTEWNVRDSDGTVVFTLAEKATGGSSKTLSFARKHKKPALHIHGGMLGRTEKYLEFFAKHDIRRLNVAGSRESKEPGIYEWVMRLLEKMVAE